MKYICLVFEKYNIELQREGSKEGATMLEMKGGGSPAYINFCPRRWDLFPWTSHLVWVLPPHGSLPWNHTKQSV